MHSGWSAAKICQISDFLMKILEYLCSKIAKGGVHRIVCDGISFRRLEHLATDARMLHKVVFSHCV
jgi:hypothetical protein